MPLKSKMLEDVSISSSQPDNYDGSELEVEIECGGARVWLSLFLEDSVISVAFHSACWGPNVEANGSAASGLAQCSRRHARSLHHFLTTTTTSQHNDSTDTHTYDFFFLFLYLR